MCGICGYLKNTDFAGAQATDNEFAAAAAEREQALLNKMTAVIQHRGPNSAGQYCSQGIGLGFRRLTIIDLSDEGNQPLFSNDRRFTLVFNGEIYNYKALRRELESHGIKFRSETDSEVLVHGYQLWGKELVKKLRGMFAFAIWDDLQKELFLARDPFGIKPLYYTRNTSDGSLLFASEIKCFLQYPQFNKELDRTALVPFLSLQYSGFENTFFAGVHKFLPAHCLTVSLKDLEAMADNRYRALPLEAYYHFEFNYADRRDEADLIAELREVLEDSVALHLQSDVPVGTFLSGGIDSSYIAALSKPEHSFSVGFAGYEGGGFNEVDYARRLSAQLHIKHHHRDLTAEDCFKILPLMQYHMDEPHGNFSAVPLYHLAKLAKEYVTVVLSGEGADELFAGYDPYRDSDYARLYKKLPLSLRRIGKSLSSCVPNAHLKRALIRAGQVPSEYYLGQMSIYQPADIAKLLPQSFTQADTAAMLMQAAYKELESLPELDQKQLIDFKYWLPGDILLKADKMSSAHSLELRVPFLDLKVWDLAARIAPEQRIHGLETKHILRSAAAQYLPSEWAKRQKLGFMVPLRDWLREDKWANLLREEFSESYAKEFFNVDLLLHYLDEHLNGRGNYQHQLYLPYIFLLWYREFFIKR